MKKYLSIFLFSLLIGSQSFSSVSLIMPHRSGQSGTQITIPIKVKDFNHIISVQGTIQFNQAIATFSSIQQFGLPGMNSGNFGTTQVSSGKLTFAWSDPNLLGNHLADSTTIFSITFNIIGTNGQSSPLSFVNLPTPVEIVDTAFVPQTVIAVNGSITVQTVVNPTDITLYMDTVSGTQGTQVLVSVRAMDFININSIQGTIKFNPAVATYAGVSYFGLPGMSIGNFGTSQVGSGKLTFSWSDLTLSGINKPDTARLFSMLFTLAGNPGTQTLVEFYNTPTPVEVTDSSFNVLNADLFSGRISITSSPVTTGITLHCDTVTGQNGTQVSVSMFANHFLHIISMQGTLQFNTSVVDFDTITYYGVPNLTISNFGLSQTGSGKLMYSWNDPTLNGVSVPGATPLFTMRFTLTGTPGSSTPVSFIDAPTIQEYVDSTFTTLNDTLVSGLINVLNTNTITVSNPNPLTYCTGSSISVSYSITGIYNPGNKFILQLSDPAGSFASPTNIDTIIGVNAGTFTGVIPTGAAQGTGYKVRVISTSPVVQSTANTSNITVSVVPTASSITGNGSVCAGSPNNIYSVTNVIGVTYNWTVPTSWALTSGQGSSSIIVNAGSLSGNICVTPSNTCGAGTQVCIPVTVNTVPAQPSVITGPASPCQGSTQTYSVTNVAGVTYNWGLPVGWTGTSTTNSINVTVGAISGNVAVTATNTCGNSVPRTLYVTVSNSTPQPSVISGPASTCAATSQTYSVVNVPGTTYTWTLPNGWTGTSTTNSINVIVGTLNGTIIVTATDACGTSIPRTLYVIVNPIPAKPVITVNLDVLTSSYANGNQWYFEGSPIGSAVNQNYTVTQNGHYFVIYTDGNGCWASSDTLNFVTVGIDDQSRAEDLSIYPNPNTGRFILEWKGDEKGIINISVINSLGETVLTRKLEIMNSAMQISIDLGQAASGVYYLQLSTLNSFLLRKLVID